MLGTQRIEQLDRFAERMVAKLQNIVDPALRVTYLGEKLMVLKDDMELVYVIRSLHRQAESGDSLARDAWSVLINPDTLVNRLDKFRRSRVYHLASREEDEVALSLFTNGPAARTSDENEVNDFLSYGMADKTVGERISVAMRTDQDTRKAASYDTDPRVIERLLVNPRTTERDVVQLAARRPSKAPVLMEIYKSKKWMTRYTVKLAVARNPYTPVNLAKNIIPSLQVKDLSDIEDDGSLHSELRDEARALIARKRKQTYLM
ncbi:MAG: hypothetical protein H6684_02330 [Deltaproteobacteria bacterium]|nr:hypothetical protein [bacterium]MCB9479781.1 hypothetical protein [Deltaproteobacteria bacterium]MCB9487551.1 hypothetical protein [Deltaproteobacteria bacterium]